MADGGTGVARTADGGDANRWLRWCHLVPPGSDRAYLRRFTLARLGRGRRLYLHRYVGSDWSRDPHDHPKWFLSVGLRGGYVEGALAPGGAVLLRQFRAPWIRFFPAGHCHRLRVVPARGALTICLTGRDRREWGFADRRSGLWTPWRVRIGAGRGRGEAADGRPGDPGTREPETRETRTRGDTG